MGDSTGLAARFAGARAQGRIALMPFLPAGYPSLDATAACIESVSGADVIEIGIPFSDPIADGPVIQEAFAKALAAGTRVDDVLAMVRGVKSTVPLVAMVSYSIVFRRGVAAFAAAAREAGFAGVIVPDLPPPEAAPIAAAIQAAGLDTVLLVAPTTPAARRAEIARLSSGFIYYLSVAGVTGERAALPADLLPNLADLATHNLATRRPVCVGFGVSTAAHLRLLTGHADGAIVGSALVRRIAATASPGEAARAAAEFCNELRAI